MKKLLPIFLIGSAVFFFLQCSSPFEPEVKEFTDPENEILREVNANQIPSLAAWVVKEDSMVWQKYYGYAEVASRKIADRNTIYGLASISKLVIVTATMQLHEQGLLNLDADINAYLPFAVRNPNYPEEKITPYHLLTHTSGLAWPNDDAEVPGYYTHYPLDSAPPLREWLPEFILPQGAHYVSTVWKNSRPGEREGYSNIGTALLAYIVEVVSHTDYNEYCKQHIFASLEMFNTSYAYADLDRNCLATLYESPNRSIGFYRFRCYPSGDLKSTVADFSHLVMAYMHGGRYQNARILQEHTVQDILKIRNLASGICLIWDYTVGDWYGHAGGKPGVAAYVEFQRDSKVALMIASNYRHNSIYPGNKIHALVRQISKRYE